MAKLKTVNIKGKEYVEVNERLIYFRKNFPNYSLTTEVLEKTENSIMILAKVSDEAGRNIATGLAEEVKGSTFINKTSYVIFCILSFTLLNFSVATMTGQSAIPLLNQFNTQVEQADFDSTRTNVTS